MWTRPRLTTKTSDSSTSKRYPMSFPVSDHLSLTDPLVTSLGVVLFPLPSSLSQTRLEPPPALSPVFFCLLSVVFPFSSSLYIFPLTSSVLPFLCLSSHLPPT